MIVQRKVVAVPVDGSGDGTAFSEVLTGRISAIHYIKDGSNGYADGVDFTVTSEATGETIWAQNDVNAAVKVAPRQPVHSTAGVAVLYAATGTAVTDKIALANDRVKIVVAAGGAGKTGTFHIVLE